MKKIISCLFLFISLALGATHNRAGEITYEYLGGRTYRATITTYTRSSVQADRCELELDWGDGQQSILTRNNGPAGCGGGGIGELVANDIKKNIYRGVHTYPGDGVYVLSFEDPNRNDGVDNIPQSVTVPFYVQSAIVVSSGLGPNSSPILLNPPIDDGCRNQRFEHNAGAFDPDGDSLSYELVNTRGSNGQEIPQTYDPAFVQDSVFIDPVTGDLIWDTPQRVGQFNFAFEITEWRKGSNGRFTQIGYVVRDLQVNINACEERRNDAVIINEPPEIEPVGPFCVEAGENISFQVTAVDSQFTNIFIRDNAGNVTDTIQRNVADYLEITAFGGPFSLTPPAVFIDDQDTGIVTGTFSWQTNCSHVRKQPYFVTISARDDASLREPTFTTQLVDLFTVEITVVSPGPANPESEAVGKTIELDWDQSACEDNVTGYSIYRREGTFGFVPGQCETGVPGYTGYQFIGETEGLSQTQFTDTNNLIRGVQYCYMVVTNFSDGAESYASEEFCAALELTAPMMTNVDVLSTSTTDGEIDVKWIAPPVLDSVQFPGPYSYRLLRAEGLNGTDFTEIQSFPGGLLDTFFTDTGLNTEERAWRYKVELYYGPNQELLDEAYPASSVFMQIIPSDKSNILRATNNTPWRNNSFYIYKETPTGSGNFEVIDTSFTPTYVDTGLVNGDLYCYYMQTVGAYTATDSLPSPLINTSQIACSTPIDTIPPCAPEVTADFNCEADYLKLTWTQPQDSGCVDTITAYRVYYKTSRDGEYQNPPLATITNGSMSFEIVNEPVTGCYAVTAIDDAATDDGGVANESDFSFHVCVEPCPSITFPNVFTPNNDGVNDFFTSQDVKDIAQLELSVFNRWGIKVYQTSNVEEFVNTGWDGTDMNSGQPVADGVYYYVATYSPFSLNDEMPMEATGFVHLFRDK